MKVSKPLLLTDLWSTPGLHDLTLSLPCLINQTAHATYQQTEDAVAPSMSSGLLGGSVVPDVVDGTFGCTACPVTMFGQLQELLLILFVQ